MGLASGTSLSASQSIGSPSGSYRLVMQTDGNLVEYNSHGIPLWAAATNPNGSVAVMRSDGNFVVDGASGNALWSSGTSGNPGAYLSLLDTGQLSVVSPSGAPLWAGPGELVPSASLTAGQSLSSPSGSYHLVMQGDGNFVEYNSSGTPVWAAATNPNGSVAVMQGDGNLVVYGASGNALWSSGTSDNPGAYLSLLDTGQLSVVSSSGAPLWAGPGELVPNAALTAGQSLRAPSGAYDLVMQSDGNLVEYNSSGTPLWAAGTDPNGSVAAMCWRPRCLHMSRQRSVSTARQASMTMAVLSLRP
jgi:hypothetical protein